MTKEQEDSIEILENTDISTIELAENTDLYTYSLAVRTVLNMLKEKDAEIEKKDKMIDLLIDKLNQGCKVFEKGEIKEIIEIYEKIKNTSDLRGIELRKNCIKQYFERIAEQSSSINKTQEKN